MIEEERFFLFIEYTTCTYSMICVADSLHFFYWYFRLEITVKQPTLAFTLDCDYRNNKTIIYFFS